MELNRLQIPQPIKRAAKRVEKKFLNSPATKIDYALVLIFFFFDASLLLYGSAIFGFEEVLFAMYESLMPIIFVGVIFFSLIIRVLKGK